MTPITLGGADEAVAQWVAKQLDIPIEDFLPCSACGVILGGEIIAGVVYSNYRELTQGSTMEASIASTSPRWATRSVLRDLFAYPFIQVGVQRFWVSCARKNKRSRSLVERLGFVYEGMARKAFDGRQDAAIYSMLPHECKWIKA